MMISGIILRASSPDIERKAKAMRIAVTVDPEGHLHYDKNLFIEPGVKISWERLSVGFSLLEKWDALVPLGSPGVLAADVGTETERTYTKSVVRDLRLPVCETRLLFVRDSEDGKALIDCWRDERGEIADPQLSFLRAIYKTKPRVCYLPQVWVSGTLPESAVRQPVRRKRKKSDPLVRVEVEPGRFVKCYKGDEQKVIADFKNRRKRRR